MSGSTTIGGIDVLSIGETMVMVTPETGGRLRPDGTFLLRPGGAESNVARHLALLGHHAAWAGALGADPLGDIVLDDLRTAGVDVDAVVRDPERPTAVYFKDPSETGTRVFYYRTGSAASAIGPQLLSRWTAAVPRVVHVSGITAALSRSARTLIDDVVIGRAFGRATVSFDVNHRPALWDGDAASELLRIARASDVVFVGLDEAETLWGAAAPEDVRALLPEPAHLVVKDGAVAAYEFDETMHRVPAIRVPVVDVVGAGDAFAAGWLSGYLAVEPPETRLAMGHAVASRVVMSPSDAAEIPTAAVLRAEASARVQTTPGALA